MWNLKKIIQRVGWWLPQAGGDGGNGKMLVKKIQIFNYKMNKFWGSNAQHGDFS